MMTWRRGLSCFAAGHMASAKPKETPRVDLAKLKKELHKGYRSTLIAIKNGTKDPIVRKGPEPQINGKWVQTPPEMINPGSVAFFGAVAKGILGGTDGKVVYTIPGVDGEYIFVWNNAKEKEKRGWSHTATDELKDSAYQVFEEGQGDKHQEVSWTIGNAPSLLSSSFESSEPDLALPVPSSGLTKFSSPVLGSLGDSTKESSATAVSTPTAATGGDDDWGDDGFGDAEGGRDRRITVNIKSAAPVLPDNTEELKSVAQAFRPAPKAQVTRVKGRGPPTLTREDTATVKGLFVVPTDTFKASQASFRSGLVSLEAGSLKSASEQFSNALNTISKLSDASTHKQAARQAARYKIATQLLLKAQEVSSKQTDLLPLLTFLAVLPLRPDHRIVNMRRLVNENMRAGNYAIASRFLKLLMPLNLRDSAKLSEKLKECEEKLKKQPTDASATEEKPNGKLVRFCYTSMKRLPGAALVCAFCGASFDTSLGKVGDQCSFCAAAEGKLENSP